MTALKNIIHLCESLRKDIDALAQKVIMNPEMAALYYEKCKQLKGIFDDKLRGSCIRARFLYVNEIDTTSKYFNIEKRTATSKQITQLKLVDNSVTEDEQVIRQMTMIIIELFSQQNQLYMIILICSTGLTSIDETERRHLEKLITFDEMSTALSLMKTENQVV